MADEDKVQQMWRPIDTLPRGTYGVLGMLASGDVVGLSRDNYGYLIPVGVYATYDGAGGVAFECDVKFWMPVPLEVE